MECQSVPLPELKFKNMTQENENTITIGKVKESFSTILTYILLNTCLQFLTVFKHEIVLL